MMANPVLFIKDGGYGETPLPPDALLKPGETLNIIDQNDGTEQEAKILAVVPVGVPVEYALADHSNQPRPLLITKPKHRSILYIIEFRGNRIQVSQQKMLKGLTAACPKCLGRGRVSEDAPPCDKCNGKGRTDAATALSQATGEACG